MSDTRSIRQFGDKWELSKYWPDHARHHSSRFRRVFADLEAAKIVRTRIEHSIALGTWRELRRELTEGPAPDLTIRDFAPIFMEHIRKKNSRPDFHHEELYRDGGILDVVGSIRLREFRRSDAVRFAERRGRLVSAATVNRAISVLSYLMTYALKRGDISEHPMPRFGRHPEEERALRVMTLEEERSFVAALLKVEPVVGVYAGILGEAGLRPSEGERLEWTHLDFEQRTLTVDRSKGKRARYIPLSTFAVELLGMLTRKTGERRCFLRAETLKPLHDVRGPFEKARALTQLEWINPEDFRHFRATQWVKLGVDLKTVQQLLGHRDIRTTMRYAHFAPSHASRSIVEAQGMEAQSLRQLMFAFDSHEEAGRRKQVSELERLYGLAPVSD